MPPTSRHQFTPEESLAGANNSAISRKRGARTALKLARIEMEKEVAVKSLEVLKQFVATPFGSLYFGFLGINGAEKVGLLHREDALLLKGADIAQGVLSAAGGPQGILAMASAVVPK